MFPFIPQNHHIRPSSTNSSHGGSNTERNFWSVWTGGSEYSENKSKKNYQKSNYKSQRIVDSVKTNVSAIVGCYASEFIPKDSKTKLIGPLDSHSTGDKVKKLVLSIKGGYLQTNDKDPAQWIKNIKHSMDTHSNNVILELSINNELYLRATRNINEHEEITLWFSEKILAAMYIPFLTPANILGK